VKTAITILGQTVVSLLMLLIFCMCTSAAESDWTEDEQQQE
jgi:hypothetical protein